jgi:hypothetical protein
MIYGDPTDEDGAPVDFISAAKQVGMQPQTLRKYLTRPQVIAFLRAERRAFREAVCAGNEIALQRVRDGEGHQNPMARVAAVRALEQIEVNEQQSGGRSANIQIGAFVIVAPRDALPLDGPIDVAPDLTSRGRSRPARLA